MWRTLPKFCAVGFGVVGLVLFAIIQQSFPLRFAYAPLNYLAFIAITLAIPVTLGGFGVAARRPWQRWLGLGACVLASIPTGVVALVAVFSLVDTVAQGQDPGFEPIGELQGRGMALRAYRTNGGATTDFGVVLRQERVVLP